MLKAFGLEIKYNPQTLTPNHMLLRQVTGDTKFFSLNAEYGGHILCVSSDDVKLDRIVAYSGHNFGKISDLFELYIGRYGSKPPWSPWQNTVRSHFSEVDSEPHEVKWGNNNGYFHPKLDLEQYDHRTLASLGTDSYTADIKIISKSHNKEIDLETTARTWETDFQKE